MALRYDLPNSAHLDTSTEVLSTVDSLRFMFLLQLPLDVDNDLAKDIFTLGCARHTYRMICQTTLNTPTSRDAY